MDQLATLEYALDELRGVVARLDDAHMDIVTNCEPWTVRRLASHALNNQLLWAGLVTGRELVSAEDTMGAVPIGGQVHTRRRPGRRAGVGDVEHGRRAGGDARDTIRGAARFCGRQLPQPLTRSCTPGTSRQVWVTRSSSGRKRFRQSLPWWRRRVPTRRGRRVSFVRPPNPQPIHRPLSAWWLQPDGAPACSTPCVAPRHLAPWAARRERRRSRSRAKRRRSSRNRGPRRCTSS
jgi:Mycothiol maleylpyruvate isomerase N-terminal domain